jgi:hypothetical protein
MSQNKSIIHSTYVKIIQVVQVVVSLVLIFNLE